MPRFNTVKYGILSLKYLGPFLWSRLTKEESDKNSLGVFKRCIKKRSNNFISDGDVKPVFFCNSWINYLCCFSLIIINVNCYMLLGNQYLCKYLSIIFTSYCTNLFYGISTVRPISVFLALERLTLKNCDSNPTVWGFLVLHVSFCKLLCHSVENCSTIVP